MLYMMVFLIALGIFFRHSKIIFVLDVIYLVCLTIFSIYVPDFANYSNIYTLIKKGEYLQTGEGWYYLCNFGRTLGLNYAEFKGTLVFLGMILVYFTLIHHFGQNDNLVWSLYILYPALVDFIQIRFFIAFSIMIFSLNFLTKKHIINYLFFFICLFVAVSIHTSTWFYMLLVFTNVIRKISKKNFYILFCSIIFVVLYLSTIGKNILVYLIDIFSNTRQNYYLTNGYSTAAIQYIVYAVIIIGFTIFSAYMNFDFKYKVRSLKLRYVENFFSAVLCFNLSTLFILPMLNFSVDFLRLQRPVWVLMYSEFAFYLLNCKRNAFLKEVMLILFSLFSLLFLLGYYFPNVLPSYFLSQ